MTDLPDTANPYHTTAVFDIASVPEALTSRHHTKPGVWGRIEVISGNLRLTRIDASDHSQTIETIAENAHAIVAPQEPHFVTLDNDTAFRVTFFRNSSPTQKGS